MLIDRNSAYRASYEVYIWDCPLQVQFARFLSPATPAVASGCAMAFGVRSHKSRASRQDARSSVAAEDRIGRMRPRDHARRRFVRT
jgi:hypothetical protein